MRKTNSKAYLVPTTAAATHIGAMSPSQTKQQSMIQMYKMKALASNGVATGTQVPTTVGNLMSKTLISKAISARRHNVSNGVLQQAKESSAARHQSNNSMQVLKPLSSVVTPGEAAHRKNDTVVIELRQHFASSKPKTPLYEAAPDSAPIVNFTAARVLTTTNTTHTADQPTQAHQKTHGQNETICNLKKQIQKQRSLQTFFNTTQRINNHQLKPSAQSKLDQQNRNVIKRGSKYTGYNSNMEKLGNQTQQLKVTAGLAGGTGLGLISGGCLSRNRSNILNFNQTQPVLKMNRTQIDLRNEMKLKNNRGAGGGIQIAYIHQQSPSVSSDEEADGGYDLENDTLLKKGSIAVRKHAYQQERSLPPRQCKLPNGSFIEAKMKNCLQSRNNHEGGVKQSETTTTTAAAVNITIVPTQTLNTQANAAYNSCQSDSGGGNNNKAALQKVMSQPQLHKCINMTQRAALVKTSFLNRDESTATTPNYTKAPGIQDQLQMQASSKSSKNQGVSGSQMKGEMKSLNLSPIVPHHYNLSGRNFQQQNFQQNSMLGKGSSQLMTLQDQHTTTVSTLENSNKKLSYQSNNQQEICGGSGGGSKKESFLSQKKKEIALAAKNAPPGKTSSRGGVSKEPTTEKKMAIGFLNKKAKYGYVSLETERAPGATNSCSTAADDIQVLPLRNLEKQCALRVNPQQVKQIQQDLPANQQQQFTLKSPSSVGRAGSGLHSPAHGGHNPSQVQEAPPIFNNNKQQNIIKVVQILNNNHMHGVSKRYDLNIMTDNGSFHPQDQSHIKQPQNNTPKAVPQFTKGGIDSARAESNPIRIQLAFDEDKTQKRYRDEKEDSSASNSSFEDEEMPDARDFDEFGQTNIVSRTNPKQEAKHHTNPPVTVIDEVKVQIVDDILMSKNTHALRNYNTAAQHLTTNKTNSKILSQYMHQIPPLYDDRNSLVNYDCSLLTHNTGRDNAQSPFSVFSARPSKPDDQQQRQNSMMPDSFILSNKDSDSNAYQTAYQQPPNPKKQQTQQQQIYYTAPDKQNLIGMLQDTQEQDEEPVSPYDEADDTDESKKREQSKQQYNDYLSEIQREEERVIDNVTQRVLASPQYRQIKGDQEKQKYLQHQLLEVRKYYKQLLIENILKQARID